MGLIMNGGWVMIALLVCSTVSCAIIVQKYLLLKHTRINKQFIPTIKQKIQETSLDMVIKELQYSSSVSNKIAWKSLVFAHASDEIVSAELQGVTAHDIRQLTGNMNVLSVIITSAPVLGLLGTVLGLMDVFSVIAVSGSADMKQLSMGISKALITTVAGLSLAIPLLFLHQWVQNAIDKRLNDWDGIPQQLIAYCKTRQK